MAVVADTRVGTSEWDELARQWERVRGRARELREVADELDAHAAEWEAIIERERRAAVSS